MSVEMPSFFSQVIQDHLELKRRNALLEGEMPLSRYMTDDPFDNHPLFKSEEQARIEDTLSGQDTFAEESAAAAWPTADHVVDPGDEPDANGGPREDTDESLWTRSRDFDWGD